MLQHGAGIPTHDLLTLLVWAGLLCWALVPLSSLEVGWLPILGGVGLILWGVVKALQRNIDQFVVTNQRVFRVNGLLNRKEATMPLSRILDISVDTWPAPTNAT